MCNERNTSRLCGCFNFTLFDASGKSRKSPTFEAVGETKQCANCDLSGVDLSGADLSFAVLTGANLSGANLKAANLSNADLTGANLTKADLSYANLNKAYLTNANLHQSKFIGASLNNTTGLPVITAAVPLEPLKPLPKVILPPLPKLGSLPKLPRSQPLPVLPQPNFNSSFNARAATPSYRRIVKPIKSAPIPPLTSKKPANSNSSNAYPDKIRQLFIEGCSAKLKPEMQSNCSCMIKKVENEYTLAEFLEISFEMSEGKQPPARFVQIASECLTQPTSVISRNLPISRQK